MIVRKEILIGLNNILGLNYQGHEQDWSIEFADPHRVQEFIDIASRPTLSNDERCAVVSLILASYDERLSSGMDNDKELWIDITNLLNLHPKQYSELLDYWALWQYEDKSNWFFITPLVRRYLTK